VTRSGALLSLLLLGACATRAIWEPTRPNDMEITLRRGLDDRQKQLLVVRIENRSQYPICLSRDVIENPYSTEIQIHYRDARRRDRTYNPDGYILEPLPGSVRIEPGASVEGRHTLEGGYRGLREGEPFPRDWQAQIGFEYGYCSDRYARCDPEWSGPDCLDRYSQRARSSWQRP
jgi:hypothetical protein